ncbi:MAG: Gfo/Idh/MocA family oxidoreductase, partial [Clostridia bacterium]|nr:Gfo/Idh/MocA family oxidoreductase [Clostridia bacterium]
MHIVKTAIIGCGARGGETYGRYINESKGKYEIIALCDRSQSKLDKYSALFGVAEKDCFKDEDLEPLKEYPLLRFQEFTELQRWDRQFKVFRWDNYL